MLKVFFRIIALITSNSWAQRSLETVAKANLALLGIGNGAGVNKSGETGAIRQIFNSKSDKPYIIFDVGANHGQFLNMAHKILCERRPFADFNIHSFEPSKSTFLTLQKNCDSLQKSYLFNYGLGDVEKVSTLYYDEIGSRLASQSKRDLAFLNIEMGLNEQIDIRTLDNHCFQNNISYVDLLKVDVEGFEMEVLRGAQKMIDSRSVRSIMFEFGGANIDTRTYFKDFYNFFTNKHYLIHRITPGGYLFPLNGYKELYEQYKTTNFLATLID